MKDFNDFLEETLHVISEATASAFVEAAEQAEAEIGVGFNSIVNVCQWPEARRHTVFMTADACMIRVRFESFSLDNIEKMLDEEPNVTDDMVEAGARALASNDPGRPTALDRGIATTVIRAVDPLIKADLARQLIEVLRDSRGHCHKKPGHSGDCK